MGILTIQIDEALGDKLRELVRDHIAGIRSGEVTGFDWDKATELAAWNDVDTALSDAQDDLTGRTAYGEATGVYHS